MMEIYTEKITCPICGAEYDDEIDTNDVPFAEFECENCGKVFCINRITDDKYQCFVEDEG